MYIFIQLLNLGGGIKRELRVIPELPTKVDYKNIIAEYTAMAMKDRVEALKNTFLGSFVTRGGVL